MNAVAQLRARFPAALDITTATGALLRRGFERTLDVAESLPGVRRDLAQSGELSQVGLAKRVREHVEAAALPELRAARRTVAGARGEVAAERRRLIVGEIDRADVAGALLRRELREHLRALPPGDRIALVLGDDPRWRLAAIEGPPALAGIEAEIVAKVEARMLAARPEAERLATIEDAAAVVDTALVLATGTIADVLAISPGIVGAWLEGQADPSAPFATRNGDRVAAA